MLNIPEEVKTLFSTDGVNKNFHVHFPNGETSDLNNENILSESVKFTESLCSQQYFKFGLAEASQIEFTAVGIPNILGAVIDCAIEIDCTSLGSAWAEQNPIDTTLDFLEPQTCEYNSKVYYRIPYGRFIVDECPRNHGTMWQRKITAYTGSLIDSDNQVLYGQFPVSSFILNPFTWFEAQRINREDMTQLPINRNYKWLFMSMFTSNGDKGITELAKGVKRGTISGSIPHIEFYKNTPNRPQLGTYVFIFDYDKHEFDNYGLALTNALLASAPSGNFCYNSDVSGVEPVPDVWVKEFASTESAFGINTGTFHPSFCISVTYIKDTGDDRAIFKRWSKPVLVEPGKPYILDLENLTNFTFPMKPPSGFIRPVSESVTVWFNIPMEWENQAKISGYPFSDITVSNWASAAPFGDQTVVTRTGTPTIYYKKIEEVAVPKFKINSTLEVKKGKALNKYYTYSNAVSVIAMITGLMEIMGAFLRAKRIGGSEVFRISENQTLIPVSRSDWEEFWWDENDVDPIGTVNAKFSDDENSGEESIMTFSIGDGASIYTMEDNVVLENTVASQAELQAAIDQYFAPNAEVINFTPVDLNMRGLPYLESGDYIQLTAEDGTTVNTYILEQTINGIQHLTADITSTNGELLEVMENE